MTNSHARGRPRKPNEKTMKRLYLTLLNAKDWVWLRELARRSKIPESTVRKYINYHMADMIEEMNLGEDLTKIVKIRLVRLKPEIKEVRKVLKKE
jgi:hypothetical protein